jgi:hypothetical protein
MRPAARVRRDGKDVLIEEIEVNGKTFSRENLILVYERPNDLPTVHYGNGRMAAPLSIGGRLLLLRIDHDALWLKTLNDDVVYSHRFAHGEEWLTGANTRIVHDGQNARIVFVLDPVSITKRSPPMDGMLRIAIWHFETNSLLQYSIDVTDFFKLTDHGYYPNTTIVPKAN